MILLDTHVLVWLRLGERLLGTEAQTLINEAWRADNLCVSAISFWELELLKRKQRIRFPPTMSLAGEASFWRRV